MNAVIFSMLILISASPGAATASERHPETARATAGGDFTLSREVIASGGGLASGGSFSAVTTTGQVIVGVQSGGGLRLTGGFHVPTGSSDRLFGDRFED